MACLNQLNVHNVVSIRLSKTRFLSETGSSVRHLIIEQVDGCALDLVVFSDDGDAALEIQEETELSSALEGLYQLARDCKR